MKQIHDENDKLVSIIMPVFNSEKYLEKSIESVLKQSYKFWELIIVDDNSNDKSVQIITDFCKKDKRIKLLLNNETMGAAKSRNKALMCSSGRWVAFLDSDDKWIDSKLEKQIFFMRKNNCSFSCSDYFVINSNDEIISTFKCSKKQYTYQDIVKTNSIGCLTVMIDTKMCGIPFMPEKAIKREDLACWLSVLKNDQTVFVIDESLAFYRIHNSVSSNKLKMIKYQWNVYRNVESIGFIKSIYYLFSWAFHGLTKY